MRFATYIRCGESVDAAAKRFIEEMCARCCKYGDLDPEFATSFINDMFRAINFDFSITKEQLESETDTNRIEWPQNWRTYIFDFNKLEFLQYEKFLTKIPKFVCEQHMNFNFMDVGGAGDEMENSPTIAEMPAVDAELPPVEGEGEGLAMVSYTAANAMDELEAVHQGEIFFGSSIDWLTQLLAAWHEFVRKLLEHDSQNPPKRFEEPMARLNFAILEGLHVLRKAYRNDFRLLDSICDRFYSIAIKGVFYIESHSHILHGLLDMFEQDYYIFYEHNAESLNLYYEALSVANHALSHSFVYKRLQRMLLSEDYSHLRILTNFLILPHMQCVFYTSLKIFKQKRLICAILEFLKALIGKVLSADYFPVELLESILALIFFTDKYVSTEATCLYLALMRRRLHDDMILQHLLEFFFSQQIASEHMEKYVKILWTYFKPMQDLKSFIRIIINERTDRLMRYFTAQVLIYVYDEVTKNFSNFQVQIEEFLLELPNIIESINDVNLQGFLLQIYRNTNIPLLRDVSKQFLEITDKFEKFVMDFMLSDALIVRSLMINMVGQLERSLTYTHNWHYYQDICQDIIVKFNRCEQNLREADENLTEPSVALLVRYRNVLCQMFGFMQLELLEFPPIMDIYSSISTRLVGTSQMIDYADRSNTFIDVHAMEVLKLILLKLASKPKISDDEKEFVNNHVGLFHFYLMDNMTILEERSNSVLQFSGSVIRLTTVISCLIDLYIKFHATSPIYNLQLVPMDYVKIVYFIVIFFFEKKSVWIDRHGGCNLEKHPSRIAQYQSSLLYKFAELHAQKYVSINSNFVWKLCIYYNLPPARFDKEIGHLLQILLIYQKDVYQHIMPIILLNVHKQMDLPIIKIGEVYRAHNQLLNEFIIPDKRNELRLNFILDVLRGLTKLILSLGIETSENRLKPLKFLNVFTEGLDKIMLLTIRDFVNQMALVLEFRLSKVECLYIRKYYDEVVHLAANTM